MKRLSLVIVASFVILSGAWSVFAGEVGDTAPEEKPRARALLDQLHENLSEIATLQVDFTQERHLSIMTDVLTSEGILLFSSPGSVRLEITKPFKSVLVTSGKTLVRYEFIDGGWRRLNAGDARATSLVMNQIAQWIRGKFSDSGKVFDIEVEPESPVRITLTPNDPAFAKRIEAIRFVFNDAANALRTLRVDEPGGDYTLMTFSNEKRNVSLDKSLFDTKLDVPVEVVGRNQTKAEASDAGK